MKKNMINASVISHVGTLSEESRNSFYINGRFFYYNRQIDAQASVEQLDDVQVYAVSENLDMDGTAEDTSISITDELKKFHSRSLKYPSNIESTLNQLYKNIEEIYYRALNENSEVTGEPALALLVVYDGKAEAICSTNTRMYLLRNGDIRQLGWDTRKAERLLKMGIITDEQAEALSERMGISPGSGKTEIKRSGIFDMREDDVILICSNASLDYIDDESIIYMLTMDYDTAFSANTIMREILKRQRKDDVTLQVIRVMEYGEEPEFEDSPDYDFLQDDTSKVRRSSQQARTAIPRRISKAQARKIKRIVRLAVSTIVIFAIVFGMFWGISRLLFGGNKQGSGKGTKTPDQAVMNPDDKDDTDSLVDNIGDTEDNEPGGDSEDTDNESTSPSTPSNGQQQNGSTGEQTSPTEEYDIYTVKSGDTLMGISRLYYNDPSKYVLIKEANNLQNDNIYVGQKLKIPRLSGQ